MNGNEILKCPSLISLRRENGWKTAKKLHHFCLFLEIPAAI